MEILDPRVGLIWTQGLIGRIYVKVHLILLHTKTYKWGPHGFRDIRFFKTFSQYNSMGALCWHANQRPILLAQKP